MGDVHLLWCAPRQVNVIKLVSKNELQKELTAK